MLLCCAAGTMKPATALMPPMSIRTPADQHSQVLKALTTQPVSEEAETLALPVAPMPQTNSGPSATALTNGLAQGIAGAGATGAGVAGAGLRAPLLWQGQPVGVVGVVALASAFAGPEPKMLESIGVEVGIRRWRMRVSILKRSRPPTAIR